MELQQLNLYMVAPLGYEHMVMVIPAASDVEARRAVMTQADIAGAVAMGAELRVRNLTTDYDKKGYDILIIRKDSYQ